MEKIKIQHYKSSIGELILGSFQEKLCLCDWVHRKNRTKIDDRLKKLLNAEYIESSSPVTNTIIVQLKEYFSGNRTVFDIPILLVGSVFQKSVWHQIARVSYGQTISYMQLAKNLTNTKAIRAVASANGANAISIIIPCHRVIGTSGQLIGYAGGLDAKKKLLRLEKASVTSQLDLF